MSEEAPWVGATPEPPSESPSREGCTRLGSCSADLHYADCAAVEKQVNDAAKKRYCSNYGHIWIVNETRGVPRSIYCDNGCGKSYRVVE